MENYLPTHRNYCNRGQTLYWSGGDSRDMWEKNMKNPKTREYLIQAGWHDEYAIEYKFNSYGFRDDEFDQRDNCLAIGCSFTEGVGLRKDQIWPTKLTNLIDTHVWNLGAGGAATDTCFRILDYYIKILNPKAVFLLVPPPMRVELHSDKGVNSYLVTDTVIPAEIKEWFLHEDNSKINRYKNILAMRQLCADAKINLYVKDSLTDVPVPPPAPARDLMHHGEKAQDQIAQLFYEDYKNGNS